MFSAVLIIGFISIVELTFGIGFLIAIFYLFKNAAWPSHRKRTVFVILGVLLISPSLAPAGTLAVIPLPLGILLAFIQSSTDAMFMLATWWFMLPSMLVTGITCRFVAKQLLFTGTD